MYYAETWIIASMLKLWSLSSVLLPDLRTLASGNITQDFFSQTLECSSSRLLSCSLTHFAISSEEGSSISSSKSCNKRKQQKNITWEVLDMFFNSCEIYTLCKNIHKNTGRLQVAEWPLAPNSLRICTLHMNLLSTYFWCGTPSLCLHRNLRIKHNFFLKRIISINWTGITVLRHKNNSSYFCLFVDEW